MPFPPFPGGLSLAAPVAACASGPIQPCPLPAQFVLALAGRRGNATPLRRVGDRVRRGDILARRDDTAATALNAPSSGTIAAIEQRPLLHSAGLSGPCIVLNADDGDDSREFAPIHDWHQTEAPVLRRRLADAGIVGLGGGGFSTAAKLQAPQTTLIINGAECEPYLACDQALMQAEAACIVAGARLLAYMVRASHVVIALQERMRDAGAALRAVLADDDEIRLAWVPTIYPQGGERQLIQVVTGREVPSGGFPTDIGIVVHNVATVYAAWRAVAHGEALTARVVSVGGAGVARPGNYRVRLGTPIEHLIATAGGYTATAARLIVGGSMTGVALPHDQIPIDASCNSVLVLADADVRVRAPELPCIRCGECARVCPVQLLPQQLLVAVQQADWSDSQALGLRDCIECGCCAVVCPSQIPLLDWYRHGKSELRIAADARRRADHARERFQARTRRLARDQAERVARVAARNEERSRSQDAPADADTLAQTMPEAAPTAAIPAAATMDKSAVLAAVARAKAKRAAAIPPAVTPPTPPQDDV